MRANSRSSVSAVLTVPILRGVAHHGDAVGNLDHFLQLVRDEYDRLAAIDQVADGREQVLRFAGRQHGRRLVQDEDLGAAIERLEDLDALAHADRDIGDAGVGIDRQAVFGRERFGIGYRLGKVDAHALLGLAVEDDVLRHGEGINQHEVLVHHADAVGDGILRIADFHLLLADEDLARS